MKVSSVSNHVADVDADTKPDGPVEGMIAIMVGHPLLNLDRAAHSPVDAIEHSEQRVAPGLNNLPTVFFDRWVDQSAADAPQPFERSYVIQRNQAAVTDHVSIDYGNQLPPAWCTSDPVR